MLGGLVPAFRGVTTCFYSGLVTGTRTRRGRFCAEAATACGTATPGIPKAIYLARGRSDQGDESGAYPLSRLHRPGLPGLAARMDEARRPLPTSCMPRVSGCALNGPGPTLLKLLRDGEIAYRRRGLPEPTDRTNQHPPPAGRLQRCRLAAVRRDSGLLEITQEKTGSTSLAPSQLIVKYIDQTDGAQRQVIVNNNAVAASQGAAVVRGSRVPGRADWRAGRASRGAEMRLKTTGLKRYKGIRPPRPCLNPGQPFRIRRPGAASLKPSSGSAGSRTTSSATARSPDRRPGPVQSAGDYRRGTTATGLDPPDRTPRAVTVRRLIEAPYREAGVIDPANLRSWTCPRPTCALAEAPQPVAELHTDRVGSSGAFVDRGTGDWCPTGLLAAERRAGGRPSVVTLTNASRLEDVTVGQAAAVDDEIVRVDAVNYASTRSPCARLRRYRTSQASGRGSGLVLRHVRSGGRTVYSQGVTLQARLLKHQRGPTGPGAGPPTASPDRAPGQAVSTRPVPHQRQRVPNDGLRGAVGELGEARPHRPGRPTDRYHGRQHRPEDGATVTLQVYSGTTLKRTYAGLTSSSWSYPLAEDMAMVRSRTCALSCAVSATASTLAATRHHHRTTRPGLPLGRRPWRRFRMTLYMGPNTGLLINGLPGEGHYSDLIRMWRWDDFLRQPVVKGASPLPTTGQAEGTRTFSPARVPARTALPDGGW